MKPDRMKHCKLTLNSCKKLEVDIKLTENVLSKNTNNIRCTVVSNHVNETTEFLIFKTKQLVSTIVTKIKDVNVNWSVRR